MPHKTTIPDSKCYVHSLFLLSMVSFYHQPMHYLNKLAICIPYLPQLFIAIFVCFLGFFVHKKTGKSDFLFFAIPSCLWQLFYFLAKISTPHNAFIFYKIGFSFVIFISTGTHHLISCYANSSNDKKIIKFSYFIGVIFLLLLWSTDWVMQNQLNTYDWGLYPKAGPIHPALLIFFTVLLFRADLLLFHSYQLSKKINNRLELSKSKNFLVALSIYSFASIDFAPNYGLSIYPIGYAFLGICAAIVAYSIVKHQFLDIKIVIRKAATYSIVTILISAPLCV